MTLLIYSDTHRSMDLFAAIPRSIIDPFLYVEHDGRRAGLVSHIDRATIREVDPALEILDPFVLGRRELLEQGLDSLEADFEVARRAVRQLGITSATVNWDFPVGLADGLRADGVELTVDHRAFEGRRRVKTPAQVEGMRRAQRAADAAMGEAAALLRDPAGGLTAEMVRDAMLRVCEDRGSELPEDVIVAVNAQSADGHESGSGPIARGDTVLIDIWPRDKESHCWADMTRTFVAGGEPPSDELLEYWRLSKAALDATLAAVRPGVSGRALHLIASKVFEDAGLPTVNSTPAGAPAPDQGFDHALGHGVGLEVHEAPNLGLAGHEELVAGDVITLEPGCYRKGFGGVRLEDLVLVTADGAENLTRFPYDLAP